MNVESVEAQQSGAQNTTLSANEDSMTTERTSASEKDDEAEQDESDESSSNKTTDQDDADSNEALENRHHSTVVEPDKQQEKSSEEDEIPKEVVSSSASSRSGEIATELEAATNPISATDYDEAAAAAGDEIERRLFVGSKITEELKKLRDQRAKRLSLSKKQKQKRKRNRKRRRQISKKNLVKMTQTRQSSSSTQNYDGTASSATDASVITLSPPTNPLANSLRQHLTNPLNLSSAVQRLVMSKLSGGNAISNNNQHQQQQQHHHFANEHQSSSTSMVINPMPNMEFLQPAEEYRGDNQAKKYHSQAELFADSFDHPQAPSAAFASSAASSRLPSSASSSASSSPPISANRQVVPIEIIGLDPAVTNSIIYGGSGSGGGTELQLPLDGQTGGGRGGGYGATPGESLIQQSVPLDQDRDHQQQQQSTRGLRNTLNQPSILHIHHFHPLAGGGKSPKMTPAGGSSSGETESIEQQQQQQQQVVVQPQDEASSVADQSDELNPPQRIQNQQLFVNEKGELVYLAVQDKTPTTEGGSHGESTSSGAEDSSEQQTAPAPVSETSSDELANTEAAHNQLTESSATGELDDQQKQQYIPAGYQQQQILIMQHPNGSRNIVPIPMHTIRHSKATAADHGEDATNTAATGNDVRMYTNGSQMMHDAEKMVMVSYRPSNTRQVHEANSSTLLMRPQSTRASFNDGQESTAQGHLAVPKMQAFAGNMTANLDLVDRLIKQMNSSSSEPASIHQLQRSVLPQLYTNLQRQQPHFGSAFVSVGPRPSAMLEAPNFRLQARPLMLDGSSFNANMDGMQPVSPDRPQYGSPMIGFRGPINQSIPFPGAGHHQTMVDGSSLFDSIMRPANVQATNPEVQPSPNSNSSTNLLTNSELINLLEELRRPSSNSSQAIQASLLDAAAVVAAAGRPTGRFEFTQASNQAPQRYVKTATNHTLTAMANLGGGGGGKVSHKPNTTHNSREISNPKQQPPLDTNQVDSVANSSVDSASDSSGISNLAMAFIFVISLVTLTLIAASLIYRYRRRSMGRCSNLAGRSRLNLTQRTKHFVRSNFVNPNDVSSIKSINLSPGSTLNTTSTGAESTVGPGKVGGLAAAGRMNLADRYTATKSFGVAGVAGGKCLSTFNANSMTDSGKYHNHDEPATDIKTLNTRLQKPSYLKSLISTSADSKQKKRNQEGAADSHYLHLKQRYANDPNYNKKPPAGGGGVRNCENHHTNYGVASSSMIANNNSKRDEMMAGRMSTINSMGELDRTSPQTQAKSRQHGCNVSPNQHRKLADLDAGKQSRHGPALGNCKIPPDINGHRL